MKNNRLTNFIRKFCNIDELVFDIALLIFFSLTYYIFKNQLLISIVNPFIVIFIFILAEFFVPFYLASIYSRFHIEGDKHLIYKLFSFIVLISSIATSVLVCYIMPFVFLDYNKNEPAYSIYIFFNLMTGTMSIILGWTFGLKSGRNISLKLIDLQSYMAIIFYSLYVYIFIITISYSIHINSAFPFFILFLSLIGLLVIKNYLKQISSYKLLIDYIFPLFLCFLLNFIFEVLTDVIGQNKSFYTIVLSGILPTRLIISFSPPFRIINFSIGVIVVLIVFSNYFL